MSIISIECEKYLCQSLDIIKNNKHLLDNLSKQYKNFKILNVIIINSVLMTSETKSLIYEKLLSFRADDDAGICIYSYGTSIRNILQPVMITDETIPLIKSILIFGNDYILYQNEHDVISLIKDELSWHNNINIILM